MSIDLSKIIEEVEKDGQFVSQNGADSKRAPKLFQLEESWRSLDLFNLSHNGRLCGGQQLEDVLKCMSIAEDDEDDVGGSDDFIIPELPQGRKLFINIRSTWGDPHYVGLNGIEFFVDSGIQRAIAKINAYPLNSIRDIPGFESDPRDIKNLLDGVYLTKDDAHLWLVPFTPGKDHLICVEFVTSCRIAMIRLWNYNKFRIHSFRGARQIEIRLDEILIFRGEITKAPGTWDSLDECFGDTILFTTDDKILELIGQNDETAKLLMCNSQDSKTEPKVEIENEPNFKRPSTMASLEVRPQSVVGLRKISEPNLSYDLFADGDCFNRITGKDFKFHLLENWGDTSSIGLSRVQFVGPNNDIIDIILDMVKCSDFTAQLTAVRYIEMFILSLNVWMWGCMIVMRYEADEYWIPPIQMGFVIGKDGPYGGTDGLTVFVGVDLTVTQYLVWYEFGQGYGHGRTLIGGIQPPPAPGTQNPNTGQ